MHAVNLRSILAPVLGAVICFLVAPRPAAVRGTHVAHFSARAVSVADNTDQGPIDILIERWSTDAERDALQGTIVDRGPADLLAALHKNVKRRAGVVLLPGVGNLGARVRTRTPKNVLFAREVVTKAGRQLVVATDQHIGVGEPRIYSRAELQEFNLLDIRIGPDGKGIGKLAAATGVAFNSQTKTFEVADYTKQPVRLIDVRVEKSDAATTK
jgi:hypothetical protein